MPTDPPVRYRIVCELPASTRTAEFTDLADHQVRVRVLMDGDAVVIVATGADVARCEQLLRSLGATEIGMDLCG